MDVGRSDPRVVDQLLRRRGVDLIVRALVCNGQMDFEVVSDDLEDAVDLARVVDRGVALTQASDGPAEDDRADPVHRDSNQLRMLDARIALQCRSHIVFDSTVREHEAGVGGSKRPRRVWESLGRGRVTGHHAFCVIATGRMARITQNA